LKLPRGLALVVLAGLASGCAGGEERAIRSRLAALMAEANKPAAEGLALVAHAASIGDYFATDAVVDLGDGSTPIQGREMLIGMVARLQPRTAAYRVALDDVEVRVAEDGESAGVAATVIVTPRQRGEDGGADAREFALTMTKADGAWRIARVTAVQTLR
jgi:hypothetical protein